MASFADISLERGLARGLQRGDRGAQAMAYRILAPTVMGLAQRILQDESSAQEVVQDTFVELIEHARTLKDARAVVGWVRTVAVNHCLMRLRSPWHKRRDRLETEPDSGEQFLDRANGSARMEGLQDIETALARLEPETRMVIWLHDVEGYTHHEIDQRQESTRGWTLRYPMATAASVFLAAVLTIVAWNPLRELADAADQSPTDRAGSPVVLADGDLAELINRSRYLEARLPARGVPAAHFRGNSSQRALIYRIADVDAELTRLFEEPEVDLARRELLWAQRVELLKSLADVQQGEAVVRPAVY